MYILPSLLLIPELNTIIGMFQPFFKNIKFNSRVFKRSKIIGSTRTGGLPLSKSDGIASEKKISTSTSPFDSSFTFQLFLIIGAMGAGYTLGKSTILNSPPATLFPSGSVTPYEVLKEYEDSESTTKTYDKFKRCTLRILESKGVEVDVKHGDNEKLFDEPFCNKGIAELMNEIDGLSDLFFGKDPESWSNNKFIWNPENTEDVSNIIRLCEEFSIPIYTAGNGAVVNGLAFEMNLSKLNTIEIQNNLDDEYLFVKIGRGIDCKDLIQKLNSIGWVGKITDDANALDLFLTSSGVNLADFKNRFISSKFSKKLVDGCTVVLPDGKIVTVKNDKSDKEDYKLFELFADFQDELCVITELKLRLPNEKEVSANKKEEKLVVLCYNDLNKFNECIKDISHKQPNIKIGFVDCSNCLKLTEKYGNYKTFGVFKADTDTLYKLPKKYSIGEETDASKIFSINMNEINAVGENDSDYYTNIKAEGSTVESGSAIIISNDIITGRLRSYLKMDSLTESAVEETGDIKKDFVRRIKLGVDSSRVLNRNVGVVVDV